MVNKIQKILSAKKLIVFDLDGTLINTSKTVILILSEMLNHRGYAIEKKTIYNFLGVGGLEMMRGLFYKNGEDHEELLNEFRGKYRRTYRSPIDLYIGIEPLLKRIIKENKILAICTNKPRELMIKDLIDTGIEKYFNLCVAGDDLSTRKPDKNNLMFISEKLGVDLNELVFIGDTYIDKQLSINAFVDFIWFNNKMTEIPAEDLTLESYYDAVWD